MLVIINALIFPTNKIYEGQFLVESFLEVLCYHVGMVKSANSKFIPLYFIIL